MTDTIEVSDKHTVNFTDNTTQKVTMTFGLLNKLAGFVQDLEQVQYVFSDAMLRESVLIECLALRDEEGDVKELDSKMNDLLTMDEALELLEWVVAHLTNFFTKALQKALKIAEQAQTTLSSPSTQAGTPD